MRWSIILLLIAFTGCQAPEDGADLRLASVDSGPLAGFVSDDPCGWDDPNAFHSTEMGERHYRAKEYFNEDEEPEVSVQISVQADGIAFIKWKDESLEIDVEGQWHRVDDLCAIEILADDGETLMYLGNPNVTSSAYGGFTAADVFSSWVDFVPDGRLGFTNGHSGDW